jgi:hypothetical protein
MISNLTPNEKLKKAILFNNLLLAKEALQDGADANYGNSLPLINAVGA